MASKRISILLHVIDISNPRFEDQVKSVDRILADLNLNNISLIRVLNKKDLVDEETVSRLSRTLGGTAISAKVGSTLMPLIKKMETSIYHMRN